MGLLPSDPKKQRLVLAALIPLVAAALYYNYLYSPRVLAIEEHETHLLDLQAKTDAQKQILARYGPNLQGRIAIFEEHIDVLERLIPRREDVPALVSQITEQANTLGVDLTMINPGFEEPGQFYARQSYDLALRGSYHDIGEYLASIGSLSRIVRPLGLQLVIDEQQVPAGQAPVLRGNFRIETFIMPDANAPQDTTVVPGGPGATG